MNFFDAPGPKFPLASVSDYRDLAKKRLPKPLFDFIDGAAFDESTHRRNQSDFNDVTFRKRVLKDVSSIDTSTLIFGEKMDLPLILAPVAFAGVYARRGEVQAALAAERANVPFTLSAAAVCPMEEVMRATKKPFWFQFNMLKSKSDSLELLHRARSMGSSVLLLTVDTPLIGTRYRYLRHKKNNRFPQFFQYFFHPKWFSSVMLAGRPLVLGNVPKAAFKLPDIASMRDWLSKQLNPGFTWENLDWVRENWPGKIVLKGILDPEDARLAIETGMDGIVVSNHGGRHIDSVPSTLSVLPPIVDAVKGKFPVLIDGGIYKGLDLLKALALGADGALIGRAWAFALAARGRRGVSEILDILKNELRVSMAQLGIDSIHKIDRTLIF